MAVSPTPTPTPTPSGQMAPAAAAPEGTAMLRSTQQAEYPPDVLPLYVAKLYGVATTPGDPSSYPDPPPPPDEIASGDDPTSQPNPPTPADAAPVNDDIPVVTQDGDTLSCTMGNWTGEPTSYAYAWQIDGVDAAGTDDMLGVTSGDIGKTATCVVTASNAAGSTAAPPSAGVLIASFT